MQKEADIGIEYLAPESRPCIEAASELYCGIVDEVERIDYEVFKYRAKTSKLRRAKTFFPALAKALKARTS
ncbi:MAG: hypothetical protein RL129_829 [Actinomycetota bacterium]